MFDSSFESKQTNQRNEEVEMLSAKLQEWQQLPVKISIHSQEVNGSHELQQTQHYHHLQSIVKQEMLFWQ